MKNKIEKVEELLWAIVKNLVAKCMLAIFLAFSLHMCYDYGIAYELNLPEFGFPCMFWLFIFLQYLRSWLHD